MCIPLATGDPADTPRAPSKGGAFLHAGRALCLPEALHCCRTGRPGSIMTSGELHEERCRSLLSVIDGLVALMGAVAVRLSVEALRGGEDYPEDIPSSRPLEAPRRALAMTAWDGAIP